MTFEPSNRAARGKIFMKVGISMQHISTIFALLFILAAVGFTLYVEHVRRKGEASGLEAKLRDIANIRTQLQACAAEIVTRMQQNYGGGSGPIKLAGATAELLGIIPEKYRTLFDEATLRDIIEDALGAAKKVWVSNPGVLEAEGAPEDGAPC